MVTMLTIGEALGVAATSPGTPMSTATELRFSTAGAEATVAIGMARLGHASAWVGAVGADEIGRRVIRDLRAEGVDTSHVRTVASAPTGFMLRDHRTRDYVAVSYYRTGSAGAQLCPRDVEEAFAKVEDAAIVHLTGITPMLSTTARDATHSALELARERHARVSFDVNYRRALGSIEDAAAEMRAIVPHVDILFIGDDETQLLTDETEPEVAARALATMGPAEVIVKLGERGACGVTASGEIAYADAPRVTVCDVIGAGDSFVAGYLAAGAENHGLADRLNWATLCAACTVGTHGDWEGLPTQTDLPERAHPGLTVR